MLTQNNIDTFFYSVLNEKSGLFDENTRIEVKRFFDIIAKLKTATPDEKKNIIANIILNNKKYIELIKNTLDILNSQHDASAQQETEMQVSFSEIEKYILARLKFLAPEQAERIIKLMTDMHDKDMSAISIDTQKVVSLGREEIPLNSVSLKNTTEDVAVTEQQIMLLQKEEKELVAKIITLMGDDETTYTNADQIKPLVERLIDVMRLLMKDVIIIEKDIDLKSAVMLDTVRQYLTALEGLSLQGFDSDQINAINEQINILKNIKTNYKNYLPHYLGQDNAAISREFTARQKLNRYVKNYLSYMKSTWYMIFGPTIGYTIRIMVDKDFKAYIIRHANELIPLIVKAIATDGESLLNPHEWAVFAKLCLDNPDIKNMLSGDEFAELKAKLEAANNAISKEDLKKVFEQLFKIAKLKKNEK